MYSAWCRFRRVLFGLRKKSKNSGSNGGNSSGGNGSGGAAGAAGNGKGNQYKVDILDTKGKAAEAVVKSLLALEHGA